MEAGQVLGEVQEAKVCPAEEVECEDVVVAAVSSEDFSQERLQRLKDGLHVDRAYLPVEQAQQIEDLVLDYADVVALDQSELGATDLVSHSIDTGDSHPIKQPARRTPFALRQTVEEMVDKMLELGVVEPSHSPWSSPVVLVEKKSILCRLPLIEFGYEDGCVSITTN